MHSGLIKCFLLALLAITLTSQTTTAIEKPDVLFFVVDDMNDWISLLDKDSPIKTPHLNRLADKGMLFTKAYCASPACNPSRASTLTGLRPSTTGVYGNKSDWRAATPNRKTIMQQFMAGGYEVKGAGKIFHHHLDGAFHDDASFHDFQHMRKQSYPPQKLNRAHKYGSKNTDWGAWPERIEDSIDYRTANYCIDVLKNPPKDKPLFLACGIFKPHSPFFAPKKYHDQYQNIGLPLRKENDWNDLPGGAEKLMARTKWFWRGMQDVEKQQEGSYQNFIRSYAACASFADDQIGRVLDGLEESPRSKNTIIVLWSDHGFHLGEKDHIEKFALWEKSNHIPLIIVAPGITKPKSICNIPVDLTVLYPTLLELAGLHNEQKCDGISVTSLLKNPNQTWNHTAIMTYHPGNHSIRNLNYRYIRYADGTEEFYDHRKDPNEWNNIAADASYTETIASLKKHIIKNDAKAVKDLKKGKK